MNIEKDQLNFAVGPVPMSEEIKKVGGESIPYFRTNDFSELMLENERLIKKFVNADEKSRALFLTASGTGAMEATVINIFGENDRLLIVNGGSFGHRFCEICDTYRIPYEDIKIPAGKTLHKEELEKYEGKDFTGFLVNMGETSTGVLYDLDMISEFCKRNNLVLAVDIISSFIADCVDMRKIHADALIISSQKALAIAPGISIVIVNEEGVGRIKSHTPMCYYLDLKKALSNGERGQTPFTPAVGTLIQLNARLNQLNKKGIEAEHENIVAMAQDFRKRIVGYPFALFAEKPSNAVTSVTPLNKDVSAKKICDILKEEYNIILCPNGGELSDKVARVGHIGEHKISDNDRLFEALDDLKKRRII